MHYLGSYIPSLMFCAILIGATAAQAELINRRKQCGTWEYIPASEQFGIPDTALLFCTEEERTWMALRIECLADEKRMAVTYLPGFSFMPQPVVQNDVVNAVVSEELVVDEMAEANLIDSIPLESAVSTVFEPEYPDVPREMIFFDFRSFGYTVIAYFLAPDAAWKFFEPEPMSPMFAKLMSGSYADISLLASETTERLPLKGSRKALRPVVETCRLAKKG